MDFEISFYLNPFHTEERQSDFFGEGSFNVIMAAVGGRAKLGASIPLEVFGGKSPYIATKRVPLN